MIGITQPVHIERPSGAGRFILLCEHASNFIPEPFGGLGLPGRVAADHVGWDIGALAVARHLAQRLDSPLVYPGVSRLVLDCNRAPDHPGLIVEETEFGPVPGNAGLSAEAREARIAAIHRPFHDAVATLVDRRRDRSPVLLSVHSFTPVCRGQARGMHVGLLHGRDAALALAVQDRLGAQRDLRIGLNVPYAPEDGAFYSLARHGEDAGLPCLMIEIRNDLVRSADAQRQWGERLALALMQASGRAHGRPAIPIGEQRGVS